MYKIFLSVLLLAVVASARDKQENWLQLSSPHFTVVCNGKEKEARHIADQFERMRLVFHTAYPNMQIDANGPIIVIAVNDRKTFRALEPEVYLKKGQLELAGLFLRAPEKNYVLLRMDAGGEHPYATVYHEYTHLLLSKADWLPLWLNEGMAEFFQNTDISPKGTVLGESDPNDIMWLHHNRLLPLATLFAVDHNSPYYHEENKGSIFYAESWALTHYLEVKDQQDNTNKLRDYMLLLIGGADPVTAAASAFGDIKQLQSALDRYIGQSPFIAFKLKQALPVDDATFQAQPITPAQADAVQADFLAYNRRESDSRTLLAQVLKEDPNNSLADETMGYLESRAGHMEQAQKWYEQAVKLDSQSYLANYYFGAIALNRREAGADIDERIEASLQKAIKLNPLFAPAYDALAVFYGMRQKNLDQAHMLTLNAVQLDPGNVEYRVNSARVLLTMGREADAVTVLQNALKLTKTPQETMAVQSEIQAALQRQRAREQNEKAARELQEAVASSKQSAAESATRAVPADEEPPALVRRQEILSGPHRTLSGRIQNVHCSAPAVMDLDLNAGSKTITLHSGNYYKIRFSALNYNPTGELHPCSDLEGMHAKVEYVESVANKVNGLIAVQLSK
jgi:Tfp pilus assembly protein PilF